MPLFRAFRRRSRATAIAALIGLALAAGVAAAPVPAVHGSAISSRSDRAEPGRPAPGSTWALPSADRSGHSWRFRLGNLDGQRLVPDADQFAARTEDSGPLLVFLPATGARPRDYRAFLSTAVTQGYHVLGLDYYNRGPSVARTCGGDGGCYTELQRNRFDGTAVSRFSRVSRSGSVLDRLTRSLTVLQRSDPHGGWRNYLEHGKPVWNRIVLAGHSQGGGEAAYIADRYRVRGVLMFSSPVDTDGQVAATWLAHRSATSPSRMYGFDAASDVYATRITGTWVRMHLPTSPGVACTHRIITTVDLGSPLHAHGRTVKDSTPRTASGAPVFLSIWTRMLDAVR